MSKLLSGGQLAGKKRYVLAGVAVVTAVASYLVGDASLLDVARTVASALLGG